LRPPTRRDDQVPYRINRWRMLRNWTYRCRRSKGGSDL